MVCLAAGFVAWLRGHGGANFLPDMEGIEREEEEAGANRSGFWASVAFGPKVEDGPKGIDFEGNKREKERGKGFCTIGYNIDYFQIY